MAERNRQLGAVGKIRFTKQTMSNIAWTKIESREPDATQGWEVFVEIEIERRPFNEKKPVGNWEERSLGSRWGWIWSKQMGQYKRLIVNRYNDILNKPNSTTVLGLALIQCNLPTMSSKRFHMRMRGPVSLAQLLTKWDEWDGVSFEYIFKDVNVLMDSDSTT